MSPHLDVVVVKIGGSVSEGYSKTLVDDVKALSEGRGVVLVHGGGRVVDELCERMGVKRRVYTSVSGFKTRITDRETLELMKMVFAGKVNKEIVSELVRNGVKAVGLSGVDGGLVRARRKKAIRVVDERGRKLLIRDDLSGKPVSVNVELLKGLLDMGYIPVIAPLGIGEEGLILNMDGDRVAARIAGELGSRTLVLLTDVEGVYLDGELLTEAYLPELDEVMASVGGGMKRKLLAAKEALQMGVREVVIASGLRENPIMRALNHEGCTVVYHGRRSG